MSYKIIIEQNSGHPDGVNATSPVKVFEQTVETLDLKSVINAINAKPRKPRTPKPVKS